MWAPDVYQGAPAPVSAFVAVVSKGAMSALLLRYFLTAHACHFGPVPMMIQIVAFASILVGNLLAPLQTNIKRILPYSSISHLGYPLVAFLAVGALRVEAVSCALHARVPQRRRRPNAGTARSQLGPRGRRGRRRSRSACPSRDSRAGRCTGGHRIARHAGPRARPALACTAPLSGPAAGSGDGLRPRGRT